MPEKAPVTVLAGHFSPLMRRGLDDAFADDRRVAIIAGDLDGAALEQRVASEFPQVVILNDEVGQAVLARLKAHRPAVGVVALARDSPYGYGTALLELKATCLPANVSRADLLDAVLLAAQGDCVFVSADGRRVQRPSRQRAGSLTPRESEVFALLSRASSDAVIAEQLDISVPTARSHVRAVLRKLNVRSRLVSGWRAL